MDKWINIKLNVDHHINPCFHVFPGPRVTEKMFVRRNVGGRRVAKKVSQDEIPKRRFQCIIVYILKTDLRVIFLGQLLYLHLGRNLVKVLLVFWVSRRYKSCTNLYSNRNLVTISDRIKWLFWRKTSKGFTAREAYRITHYFAIINDVETSLMEHCFLLISKLPILLLFLPVIAGLNNNYRCIQTSKEGNNVSSCHDFPQARYVAIKSIKGSAANVPWAVTWFSAPQRFCLTPVIRLHNFARKI